MKKYQQFNLDSYDLIINVICCKDWKEEVQRILKKEGYETDEEEKKLNTADGFSMLLEGKIYVFFAPDASDHIIHHECVHLIIYVMHLCHLKADVFNSEPIAYLGEYIIKNVMRIKKATEETTKKPKMRTIKKPSKRGTLTKAQVKKAIKEAIKKRKKK